MYNPHKLLRPLLPVLLVVSLGACGGGSYYGYHDGWSYYPYDYPWHYSSVGTWAVVGRPLVVVDTWTKNSFAHRRYRGYALQRHNSPSITYLAKQGGRTIEVVLTPRNDSTQIEIKTRNGEQPWDRDQAKALLGRILQDYKAPPAR